jgi:hypothetical protein
LDRGSTNAAASILEQAEKSLKGWVLPLNMLRQDYEKDQTLLFRNLDFYDKDLFYPAV